MMEPNEKIDINRIFLLLLIACILLIPTLFFPISPDLTVFLYGGKTIAEGGNMYADFIDIKPPAVYLFMVPVYKFFSGSEVLIRLFDLIYQLAAIISIFVVIFKRTRDGSFAWLASIFYAMIYGATSYEIAFQCETFIGLPLIWALYFMSGKPAARSAIIAGLLLGFACSLKYSLAMLVPASFLIVILESGTAWAKRIAYLSAGIAAGFAIPHSILLTGDSFHGYFEAMRFLGGYVSNSSGRSIFDVIFILRVSRFYLGQAFSYSILAFAAMGVYTVFGGRRREYSNLTMSSVIISIALWGSIIFEAKYMNYHWIRLIAPVAVLAGSGGAYFWKRVANLKSFSIYKKIATAIILIAAVYFSPQSGLARNSYSAYLWITSPSRFDLRYEDRTSYVPRSLSEWKYVANRLKGRLDDKTMIVSHGDQPIYYYMQAKNISKFAHSGFYLSTMATDYYKSGIEPEIKSTKVIIIRSDVGDVNNLGTYDSDWKLFEKNRRLAEILDNNFYLGFETTHFRIFLSKDPHLS